MKIITNFIAPDEGEVYIGGKPIGDNPYEIKKHIGYLAKIILYIMICQLSIF